MKSQEQHQITLKSNGNGIDMNVKSRLGAGANSYITKQKDTVLETFTYSLKPIINDVATGTYTQILS